MTVGLKTKLLCVSVLVEDTSGTGSLLLAVGVEVVVHGPASAATAAALDLTMDVNFSHFLLCLGLTDRVGKV